MWTEVTNTKLPWLIPARGIWGRELYHGPNTDVSPASTPSNSGPLRPIRVGILNLSVCAHVCDQGVSICSVSF